MVSHICYTHSLVGEPYNEIRCLFGNNTKGNTPVVPSGVHVAFYYGDTDITCAAHS